MVPRIGNLVKDGDNLPPDSPAKVDLRLQFLLRGDNTLHGARQRLAVPPPPGMPVKAAVILQALLCCSASSSRRVRSSRRLSRYRRSQRTFSS